MPRTTTRRPRARKAATPNPLAAGTTTGAPAPIVIRPAHSLPLPETFAPTLAAHIKAGGRMYFRDIEVLAIDEWLVRLDAEMHALGHTEWAANVPGSYCRGWTVAGLDLPSEPMHATVAELLKGSATIIEWANGYLGLFTCDGELERNHFSLDKHERDYQHPFGNDTEVCTPVRDIRLGIRLAGMPVSEADQDDAAFVEALEAEELLLKHLGDGPLS